YAKDIVESDFISLTGDTNALDAAKIMKEKRHGFAIIVAEGKPVGIVTEWDYLSRIVAGEKNPASLMIKEIMSENVVSVKASDGIDYVSKLMADRGIRRVLVVDKGKIVGVITAKTVLSRLEDYINSISSQIARLNSPL
ncbi:MAG TPA: CBS domain-containing protein, partial [Nitrososphaerales archaeon]|nr:CBS domain-containing protein [Nitrososphaerales archaeon]